MSEENKPNSAGSESSQDQPGPQKEQAPAAKPEVPKKAAAPKPPAKKGPAYEDLEEDALLDALRERFPEGIVSGQVFLDQPIYTVTADSLYDVMLFLRDTPDWNFDYLVDETVLDYLDDEKRFCLVYHLYSHKIGKLIRIKSRVADGDTVPSMTSIWKTANWLEREIYDMFGVEFFGHPDLKRILLPDDWHGYPLRKDYGIKQQDEIWIKEHLRIRENPS